jgi:DNA mismatch endonuclease (patch repair protein)
MDRRSEQARSENMRRIRSKDSKPELAVRRLVHSLGYRYRLHHHGLPGRPDIVFSQRRKVVFIHGCFWHQHAGCKIAHRTKSNLHYWKPKLQRNKRRDMRNLAALNKMGWKTLVVWECETANLSGVRKRVRRFLGPTRYVG